MMRHLNQSIRDGAHSTQRTTHARTHACTRVMMTRVAIVLSQTIWSGCGRSLGQRWSVWRTFWLLWESAGLFSLGSRTTLRRRRAPTPGTSGESGKVKNHKDGELKMEKAMMEINLLVTVLGIKLRRRLSSCQYYNEITFHTDKINVLLAWDMAAEIFKYVYDIVTP